MELARKNHCFACTKGALTRTEQLNTYFSHTAVYTCDLCLARKEIYLADEVMPLQTYFWPDGRTTSYVKRPL